MQRGHRLRIYVQVWRQSPQKIWRQQGTFMGFSGAAKQIAQSIIECNNYISIFKIFTKK